MSNAALVEEVVPNPKTILKFPAREQAAAVEFDPHPLVTVAAAMAIAFAGAVTFVGSILIWLALRHSGVLAP
jgi:hypothetical protein